VASILRAPFNDQPTWKLAQQWADHTTANIRTGTARGPEHYFQVRYEDLVRAPLASLGLVCRFLGEEFESSMLLPREESTALFTVGSSPLPWQATATAPVGALQVGPGGASLSTADRARLAAAIRARVGSLGYDEPRRRTVVAGVGLAAFTVPHRLSRRLGRLGRGPLSPAERFLAVQRYTQDRVTAALAATPPAGPFFTDDEDFSAAALGAVTEVVAEALAGH
jgi:hypothetical protein